MRLKEPYCILLNINYFTLSYFKTYRFKCPLTFRSKCATLQSCRCWTASRICFTKPTASFSVHGFATTSESNNLPFGNSSSTSIQFLSFSKESTNMLILGCFRRRKTLTSRSTSCWEHIRFLMSFAAYSLPLILSTHFLTTEYLPLKSRDSMCLKPII